MSNWLPSLNALRAFEVTARKKSYRKAAEELGVTTAAVKQLVEKLESLLGEKLFLGRGQNLKITSVGEVGLEELSISFKQIERTVNRMKSYKNKNRIVITCEPSFASAWLVPRLNKFKTLNPSIEVLIDSSPKVVSLSDGSIDLAIRFGVNDYSSRLNVERLYDESLAPYCSPSLIHGSKKISKFSEIENYPLLRWDTSQFNWSNNTKRWMDWENWIKFAKLDTTLNLNYGPKFTEYNLALQCAIAGQGFILGSTPVLSDLIKKGLLIDPFNLSIKTDLGYDLVYEKKAFIKPEIEKFISWIVSEKKNN
jgi:LysR family glycine cleavage system transcriptional activator